MNCTQYAGAFVVIVCMNWRGARELGLEVAPIVLDESSRVTRAAGLLGLPATNGQGDKSDANSKERTRARDWMEWLSEPCKYLIFPWAILGPVSRRRAGIVQALLVPASCACTRRPSSAACFNFFSAPSWWNSNSNSNNYGSSGSSSSTCKLAASSQAASCVNNALVYVCLSLSVCYCLRPK